MNKDVKVTIDTPHGPYGKHVDVIVPLPAVRGAQKLRIEETGEILTEDIGIKGGYWKSIADNTR